MDYIQTELNLGVASISTGITEWRSPQYDPTWDEAPAAFDSTCKSVGEQVASNTQKSAHQHERDFTQWVEKYWVERGTSKYWYYRYTWLDGRKLRRKYLGSVTSARVKGKKQLVERYIRDGLSPQEITTAIDHFSASIQTH